MRVIPKNFHNPILQAKGIIFGLVFSVLGLLIDAKQAGLITEIKPLIDQLDALRFRLAPQTRLAVLRLVGEI